MKQNSSTKVNGLQSSPDCRQTGVGGSTDLERRVCCDCDKTCLVIPVYPADDEYSYLLATGCFVEPYDEGQMFVLCDDCADKLYQEGRLGYGGSGDAFMVR